MTVGVCMDEMQQVMQQVLTMLESLPENEMVQGSTARDAATRLRESMRNRERIFAEQAIHVGQGGGEVYNALSHRMMR